MNNQQETINKPSVFQHMVLIDFFPVRPISSNYHTNAMTGNCSVSFFLKYNNKTKYISPLIRFDIGGGGGGGGEGGVA